MSAVAFENVLAFDTATGATAVALGAREARDDPPAGGRPGHARALLSLIEQLLRDGGGWERIERIAVGIGPGTFTGLRIGIATAHALARARSLPLVGVSTLASLELGARECHGPETPILAVIDARRGEAFVAGCGLAPTVLTPAALGEVAGTQAGNGVIAVGDGALKFRQLLEAAGARVPDDDAPEHRVSAVYHCRLAVALEPGPADTVAPQYLRVSDAELSLR
jgi:tRNA threonylcarbamoyladenosine biosynthesis protein TsaB